MGQESPMGLSLQDLLSTAELLPSASTRRFYRTEKGVVLTGSKVQINEYLTYHKLLSDLDIPRIIEIHDDYLLLEDLGSDRLEVIEDPPYGLVIEELIKWQKATGGKKDSLETFGYSHLKWEYQYFLEYALRRFFKVEPPDSLIEELEGLVRQVDKLPKVLMHRDFQSRNIFIMDGKVRIIDFQNAMLGPASYDLASLLFDPYRPIRTERALGLLEYYNSLSDIKVSKRDLFETATQRLLQSLGAYAFLILIRGLDYTRYLKVGIGMVSKIIVYNPMPMIGMVIGSLSQGQPC